MTEITMQHTQLEHHLLERVDAMSAKMADFIKSYHELQSQSKQVAVNLAAIEEEVGVGKQREKELAIERSRYLDAREELKDKLQAADDAKKNKAQYNEGVALQNLDLRMQRQSSEKKLSSAVNEAQHRLNEVNHARADAFSIQAELDDLKLTSCHWRGQCVHSQQAAGGGHTGGGAAGGSGRACRDDNVIVSGGSEEISQGGECEVGR